MRVYDVCVVGMGYVGVTLAAMLANKGLRVFGLEVRPEVVTTINSGAATFHENGLDEIIKSVTVESGDRRLECGEVFPNNFQCGVFIITVGTPLDAEGRGRVDMIIRAAGQVAAAMLPDSLVILRSTVLVGTTKKTVLPVLEASGKSFHLAMCPERTLEGSAVQELESLPQVIGGLDSEASRRAAELFGKLTPTTVIVDNPETAEMVKLVDNTFRDVQFAFGNEVARACEAVGIKAFDVISAGKLGYPRTKVALPGPVGGPCLEKDPHILMQSVTQYSGITLEITKSARMINERQPSETIKNLSAFVASRGMKKPLKIVIAGLAFKGRPETDDLRGSMAFPIYSEVERNFNGSSLFVYDPVICCDTAAAAFPTASVLNDLAQAVSIADIFVIANNHPIFSKNSINFYAQRLPVDGILFDYWNHFSSSDSEALVGRYISVGNLPKI